MANMSKTKVKMPEQDPRARGRNFSEVAKGYTREMAMEEAERCIQCKNKPCVKGCPVEINIPGFTCKVAAGDMEGAYDVIKQDNSLPAICGRVCPQESQCEAKCVRGIKGDPVAIGRLERFVADDHMSRECELVKREESNGYKVAVVGSGPAGLSCAGELVKMGYDVTIYEAFHVPGGVLRYGIPEFRLPKDIVDYEIDQLRGMGVAIECNVVIGRTITVDELFEMGYKAVFVGSGAGLPNFMNIPGENLIGVYSANEFLTRINLMKAYKKEYDTPILEMKNVAVIGGGNVAMDAARSALRLGADNVYIVYRRSMEEMPARAEEIDHAGEEGIQFNLLVGPVKINGDENGRVRSMTCIKMELGEPDDSGRRRPRPIPGSEFDFQVDGVIVAVGNSPNPLIKSTTEGMESNRWGCIVVNEETLETTRENVFAGGDAVTGAATVILAMGAGKQAARSIDRKIRNS